jgi:HEAT repeat protein
LKPTEPQDGEQLADARLQALYQVTQDAALLKPFYDRLASTEAKTRESGVVAFRFLRLKEAPAALVATLKDENEDVRSWGALVLGEIRDAKSAKRLLDVATDMRESLGVRCNAIQAVGGMKVATLADPLRKLLTDEQAAIQAQAAIALYRLTGEKAKQFPDGYPVDPPACD